MSAVRYKKQLAQLEVELEARLARLKLLEAENSALKQKERALQSCISGLESGLSATRTVLRSNSLRSNSLTVDYTNVTGSLPGPETLAGSAPKTLGLSWSPSTLPSISNTSSSDNDAAATLDSASSSSPVLALPTSQSSAVLAALEAKEQQVQQIINQLGCGSSYTELYSSKLLERATSDPARAASFVSLDRDSRLKYLIQAIQRMALLLPKYGTAAPATSTGSAQQQLDGLIDEVSEMVLTCGLLDPPSLKLDWLMTHLETLQYEPYPEGWWQQVAQTLELTGDQKAALQLCWTRVKTNKAALTAEHEKLLSRLNQLRQQQHNSHKQFGEIAQAVAKEQMPYSVDQLRQRQQQLRSQLEQLAHKQQQRQQQKIALQQQQQQQQVLSPRFSHDEQYMELEFELQEVERLLFQDLDGQEEGSKPEDTLQDIQQWLFEDGLEPQEGQNPNSSSNTATCQLNPVDPDPLGFLSRNSRSSMSNNPVAQLDLNPSGLIQQQQQQGFVQGYSQAGFGTAGSGFNDLQQQQQQGFVQGYSQAGSGAAGSGFTDLMTNGAAMGSIAGFNGQQQQLLQPQKQQQLQDVKPYVGLDNPVGFMDQGTEHIFRCDSAVFGSEPPAVVLQQQQQHQQQGWMQQHSVMQVPQQQQQQHEQQPHGWRSAFSTMAQQQQQQQPAVKQSPYTPALPSPAATVAAPIKIKGSKKGRSIPAPSAAAAAAAAGSSAVSASAPAAFTELLQSAIDQDECASLTTVKTAIIEEGEMLLQISSQEQQEIERHLDVIKDRVKMQHFCQLLAFHNTFTKKQLAAFYVVSYPYLPDALSICEALDELGW